MFRAIVEPTLREWLACEPEAAEPMLLACLWGDPAVVRGSRLDCLRAVLTRPPDLHPARRAFVRAAVDLVAFAQHEWPHGYLGDPSTDLDLLAEAEAASNGLPDDWRAPMVAAMRPMATWRTVR